MELVLVQNLCGTFCFSMQAVVFMDLVGTVVLPVAISLTYALVVGMALDPPQNFEEAIPLVLLISVLGLPAILILITTRKVVYIFWMFIYLAALPIWNFILPVYAFWHFDDFSWGETRKVEGERKGEAHGEGHGTFDGSNVPMRRWEDWERSRLRKLKREDRRRREMSRAFPSGFGPGGNLGVRDNVYSQYGDGSDTQSIASSFQDDDQWGPQIGGYNENNPAFPPPPDVLIPKVEVLNGAGTIGGDDLEAMLEVGFDDRRDGGGDLHMQQQNASSTHLLQPQNVPRFQLSDGGPSPSVSPQPYSHQQSYIPVARSEAGVAVQPPPRTVLSPTTPLTPGMGQGMSTAMGERQTHARKRSGGHGGSPDYGPLGPLDPGSRF